MEIWAYIGVSPLHPNRWSWSQNEGMSTHSSKTYESETLRRQYSIWLTNTMDGGLLLNSIWNINTVSTTCTLYGYQCSSDLCCPLGPQNQLLRWPSHVMNQNGFVFLTYYFLSISLFWEFCLFIYLSTEVKWWFKFEMLDDDKTRKGKTKRLGKHVKCIWRFCAPKLILSSKFITFYNYLGCLRGNHEDLSAPSSANTWYSHNSVPSLSFSSFSSKIYSNHHFFSIKTYS